MSTSLDKLNAKVFSEYLHTQFKLHLEDAEPMMLKLVEVKESDPSPQIELFALHFLGAAAPRLPQKTYQLEHEKLGTFAIFLTAIAGDPQGIMYESIFHRFRKTAP